VAEEWFGAQWLQRILRTETVWVLADPFGAAFAQANGVEEGFD